ncbi:MAG: alpha/beta hydrolase, partial [Anaerolineae bacterium]
VIMRFRDTVVHVRLNRILVFIILLGLLGGCQTPEGEGALASSDVQEPEMTSTPTLPLTWTPTPSPTATPTMTPTPTIRPTITPFVCTQSQGETQEGAFWSQAIQEDIRFLVHLPPCYPSYPYRAFPVLYLLHGWPLNEHHWKDLGITDIADIWISQGLIGPLIIVMPGVTDADGRYVHSSGGDQSFEGVVVNELVPMIDAEYRTWRVPEGRAIGGISRGGVWSLEIGLRNPDVFGIVGGHSPALAVNHPLPAYDPFFLAESGAPGQRVYLDAGDIDWTRAATLQLHDLLLEKGADVVYQVHEGGHVDALWRQGLPDYLHFYTRTWPATVEDLPERRVANTDGEWSERVEE